MWNQYEDSSPSFLTKHHDLILYDVYHHIKAFLLFPPKCSCEDSCQCSKWRRKITLALNTKLYNRAVRAEAESSRLFAMKTLWNIPEAHSFRPLYPNSYPVWVIEKELKEREEDDHFQIIDQLVWTFLRLGETYKACWGDPDASVNKVFNLLKKAPAGTKKAELKKDERRCGKKEYEKQFKRYQSVCHFIAALNIWKREVPNWEKIFFAVAPPLEHIKRLLSLSHWFRKQLLSLKRPNVKENVFLLEEDLFPLPLWVQSDDIDLPIEPFEEKIREVWSKAVFVDPKTKIKTPCPYSID